ncbi:hypothetical protein BKA70DRAFT_1445795 [Coprinopsis sp. MPI-PUGE-AT-0042]|nr:hypothetical protein BKA70DRAFT_1445795 [Coprinopsis sp. MPI-PUGE-AT-0042]
MVLSELKLKLLSIFFSRSSVYFYVMKPMTCCRRMARPHERMIQQLILSTAANTELMECPESSAILQSHRITKGTQASNVLCRYIALLRVFDVASTLEGRQRGARIAKWHGWEPAENPPSFGCPISSPESKQALNTFAAPSDDANRTEESLTTMPLDTPHRIMKELAHSMTKAKGCQIVSNIPWRLSTCHGSCLATLTYRTPSHTPSIP